MARARGVSGWLLLSLLLLVLTLFSPLLLFALGNAFHHDWLLAANVGQTYGFASAILSGLALLSVAYTVWLQHRESRIARSEAHRPIHMQLLTMAIEDPVLLKVWNIEGPDDNYRRQHLYINLIVSWWHQNFTLAGTMSEAELRQTARRMFEGEAARRYWSVAGPFRRSVASRPSELRFLEVMDDAHAQAAAAVEVRGSVEDVEAPPGPVPEP